MVPEIIARPESKAAAKWWADQLRQLPADSDTGAFETNLVSDWARRKLPPIPKEQVDAFEQFLIDGIEKQNEASEWREWDPKWGGYFRTVAMDYGPDLVLRTAAEKAEILSLSLRLPLKTVMWINPGEVFAAVGYRAPGDLIIYQR